MNLNSIQVILYNGNAVKIIIIFNNKREARYLERAINEPGYLIKSLNEVYIAAKTPNRDKMIVKMGVFNSRILSSLVPPHVVTSIMAII